METISCLLTFEHSLILCQNADTDEQNDDISVTLNANPSQLSPENNGKQCSPVYTGGSSPDIAAITRSSRSSERIKTIRYHFDIIGLLSKSQQALVLFDTFFQHLTPYIRGQPNSEDITNDLLLELLFAKIDALHDREIKLSESDCLAFINQVNQRSTSSDYFLHKPVASNNQLLTTVARFRCFIKKLSANSILVTLIPVSFSDLKSLVFGDDQGLSSLRAYHEIDDVSVDGERLHGCLSFPVFIYKTSFNALSDQLVYTSESKQWRDLYLDNTNKSQKSNSCCHPFKLFKSNESESETLSKSSIRQFCRSLRQIYWNCMTQALYRSLQMGHCVDRRDILKIVENISDKFVLSLDVSKFMIYLCEHLKDFLLELDTTEENFDVNKYVQHGWQNQMTLETKTLALSDMIQSSKCSDIKDLHLDIKDKFQETLQHYLSPIASFPSFYFFNHKPSKTLLMADSVTDSNLVDKSSVSFISEELPNNSTINSIINSETKANIARSDDSYSQSTLKSCPKNEFSEENVSLSKSNSSKISYNALDLTSEDLPSTPNLAPDSKDDTLNSETCMDIAPQPLFLRLSCSIQTQFGVKECFPYSLPTCLREIADLLDTQPSG